MRINEYDDGYGSKEDFERAGADQPEHMEDFSDDGPIAQAQERLEYLRGELRAERISYGELAELKALAPYILANDSELLEAAGVLEFDDDEQPDPDQIKNICGQILAGYAQGKSGLDDGMVDLLIELGDLASDIIALLNRLPSR